MIKTLTNLLKQDKEKFVVPKGVQDCIPITAIYDDGIFRVGKDKYSKSFKFTDINFAVASREDKEAMFLEYSELLNSLDSGATTIADRRQLLNGNSFILGVSGGGKSFAAKGEIENIILSSNADRCLYYLSLRTQKSHRTR